MTRWQIAGRRREGHVLPFLQESGTSRDGQCGVSHHVLQVDQHPDGVIDGRVGVAGGVFPVADRQDKVVRGLGLVVQVGATGNCNLCAIRDRRCREIVRAVAGHPEGQRVIRVGFSDRYRIAH